MNQASSHLTDAQISDYVQDSTRGPAAQQLEAHLTDCESCLDRLLHAERIHLGLLEGNGMKRTPYPGCPPEEALQELAAGICASDTAQTTTDHAAHCNYCGPLLNRYVKEFSEDLQPEDAAVLRELKTSTPGWQKSFIRENLRSEKQEPQQQRWLTFWPRLLTATAVGVAAAVAAFYSFRPNDLEKAQQLVASAYSERRTTEMRLTGVPYAQYSPLPVERGGDAAGSMAYQRPSLLRAGAAVGDKLRNGSNVDPRWLQIKARLDLLEATPASAADAQQILEKARSEGLNDPGLDIDLAASSFQRASTEDNADLSATIDLLRAALDDSKISHQEQLVALFDLGIAYQKSKMFDLAIETWNKYLQLDSSSEWANEARERLDDAKKAAPPKTQSYLDTQTPLFFLKHSDDAGVLEHLDVYQDWALRFWMLDALKDPAGESAGAIGKLSLLLAEHDLDCWLKEFLAAIKPEQAPAVKALSAAIRANKRGFYGVAVEQARQAVALFAQYGNNPGEIRARFETIYASQRFLEGFDCLAQIASLQTPDRYRWLRIQLDLEKYTCSNFGGQFAATEQGLRETFGNAERWHFHLLALRAIALEASISRQQRSECHESWQHAIQGLGLYWTGKPYPPERLYEFYSILEQCAAQTKMLHAAEALQRHSIAVLESPSPENDPNLTVAGSAHAELAAIMTAEYNDSGAKAEEAAAESLWSRAGDEQTANRYRLFMRIHLAEIQLKRGDAKRALSTLNASSTLLNSTQYRLLSLNFYRLLGNTYWRLGRLSEATAAYADGITIAESSLRTLQINARDRLQWVSKMDEVYRGMARVSIEQGRAKETWRLWEWYRTRSMIRTTVPSQGLGTATESSWRNLQAQIADVRLPSEGHLVYASFDDGLEAWTVDKVAVRAHWIPIRQPDLVPLVNDFAEKCADPSSPVDEIHRAAQALYELLVRPLASDLPQSGTVVVELDQPLSRLILPALMDAGGKYFGESHSVVYSPGVLMEQTLRPARPVEATDRMLLVDASEPVGAGAVPGHIEERQAALHAYRQVRLVSGSQTTPAEIRHEMSQSTVFDFIGHGEQHDSHTELRLNSKTSLAAEDFPPAALAHLKLSILSGCSTGVSSGDRLLDTANLVHPFLAAGVPEVIATQWNVDSGVATQLMQNFYAHLGAGESVPKALFMAQKEILIIRNHPYFWAGFNLSGRAN